ncbi:MAG: DNA polymerase III subunit delta' [Desulfovibrionaceae bacterium]|nr:DNA polymerase III subunit delta' [Desulfovibrionaceae bacterium]
MIETEAEYRTPEEASVSFSEAVRPEFARYRTELLKAAPWPPRVLIIDGGTRSQRLSLGLWYAALLNCVSHGETEPCLQCRTCLQIAARSFADLIFLDGSRENIKIDAVRSVLGSLGQKPHGSGKRVILFAEAQKMSADTPHVLLKTMEEPRYEAVFLLLAPLKSQLLPTFISRSWSLTLPWNKQDPFPGQEEMEKELISFLRTGQGWFSLTGSKISAGSASSLFASLMSAQSSALSGHRTTDLEKMFGVFNAIGNRKAYELLEESIRALSQTGPNVSLILNRAALSLYEIVHAKKSA